MSSIAEKTFEMRPATLTCQLESVRVSENFVLGAAKTNNGTRAPWPAGVEPNSFLSFCPAFACRMTPRVSACKSDKCNRRGILNGWLACQAKKIYPHVTRARVRTRARVAVRCARVVHAHHAVRENN